MLLALFLGGTFSCSVKKNYFTSKAYHKTLAHYNGYFNAREKVKNGAKSLATSQKDKYDRILPVFKHGDPALAKAVMPDMDEAIKKVSIVIQRHSMEIDGKERNKWIPQCYLLIGVAQYYKSETWTAIEAFQYVASQYRNDEIRYEALLWLTLCYLRLGKGPDAEYLLSTFRDDAKFPARLKPFYNAIAGEYYLQTAEYKKASAHLEKAAATAKKRADKSRYNFILGQVYQKTDKCDSAVSRYNKVIKTSPSYELAFNARINRARCIDLSSPDGREIKEMLTKMLKDDKNLEYQDQIYYALGEISQKESNIAQAIDYYQKSVAASQANTDQKALSFLKLAQIHFLLPHYPLAQAYYDSTVTFLSNDHPDYVAIVNTKNHLTKLIKNLNIIQTEDSLQRLAGLSQFERETLVEQIIASENREKEQKEQEAKEQLLKDSLEQQSAVGDPNFRPPVDPRGQTPGNVSGWYFSNTSALSFGYTEFIRKWGNRKLEDNWRRSLRASFVESSAAETGNEAGEDSLDAQELARLDSIRSLDNSNRKEAYLAEIPLTPEEKEKSDAKIIEAYYNVGVIYKEQLKNNTEAIRNFETLLTRYPENKYKVAVWYNLYRINIAIEEEERANYYKKLILDGYPDTDYAKLILNPDYYKEQQRKVAVQKVFYETTYRAFLNKQYADVIERKSMADSLFPGSDLAPKFELLKAMAIGKTRPLPEFEASLKGVITRYPEDTVSWRAQQILDLINPEMRAKRDSAIMAENAANENGGKGSNEKVVKSGVPYKYAPDTAHYVLFIYKNQVISTDDFKVAVSNYNTKYFSSKGLSITNSFIGNDQQFVMVRQFRNGAEAKTYLDGVLSDSTAFMNFDMSMARSLVISPDNMILLIQNKDAAGYEYFFEEKYKK
ncbi:MAG TPA: tetratricopeptide repeat protein [Bacteroidia bacterium]|nr:tetratricopeptide repeat protein [Bacteroidia bacterium]